MLINIQIDLRAFLNFAITNFSQFYQLYLKKMAPTGLDTILGRIRFEEFLVNLNFVFELRTCNLSKVFGLRTCALYF